MQSCPRLGLSEAPFLKIGEHLGKGFNDLSGGHAALQRRGILPQSGRRCGGHGESRVSRGRAALERLLAGKAVPDARGSGVGTGLMSNR
jgi:hypothetical protein